MATKNLELTTAQKNVLRLYREHVEKFHVPPTLRHLAGLLGVTHAAIQMHVKRLEEKGYLAKRPVTEIRLTVSLKGKRVAL